MKKLIFVILFLSPRMLCAEISIKGRIVDKNKQALEYVKMTCESNNNNQKLEVLSDKEGNFEFSVTHGVWTVMGYYWGKKVFEKEIEVKDNVNLGTISVNKDLILNELTISADKPLIKRVQDKLVFNAQNFSLKNSLSGLDMLSYVPQVSVLSDKNIVIKGKLATVFINEQRFTPEEAITYLQNLRAKEIKQVEVQTAAASDLDANIQSGVLHIYTQTNKKGLVADASTSLDYSKKWYYKQNSGVNLNYGSEKWNIYGSTYYNNGEGLTHYKIINRYQQSKTGYFETSDYYFYPRELNYKIGGFIYPSKNRTLGIELNSKRLFPKDDLSVFNTEVKDVNLNLIDMRRGTTAGDFKQTRFNSMLFYKWESESLMSRLRLSAFYTHQNRDLDNDLSSYSTMNNNKNIIERNISSAYTNNYSFLMDYKKMWKSGLTVLTGLKNSSTKSRSNLNSSSIDNPVGTKTGYDYNENIAAVYGLLHFNINQKISTRVGFRAENTNLRGRSNTEQDNITKNYWHWFPSALITYTQSSKLSYQLKYSKTIYRPSFYFLTNFKVRASDNVYDIGNPYLKPEISHYVEASVQRKSIMFDVYYFNKQNTIAQSYETNGDITYHSNKNFGRSEQMGMDLSCQGKLSSWLFINYAGNFDYSKIPSNYSKKEQVSWNFNLNNIFTISERSKIELLVDYYSPVIGINYYSYNNYGASVAINQSFLNKSLNMRLAVNDVFNTRRIKTDFAVPLLEYKFYQKSLSRSISFSLSYSFATKQKIKSGKIDSSNEVINRL